MSVLERFEQQATSIPDFPAVRDKENYLTYRELNERANRVAAVLRKAGVRPDMLVGLFLNRTIDLISGLLGIWKAGAAYLPLDPDFPSQRLTFMLEDCEAKYLLTEKALSSSLPEHKSQVIYLEDVLQTALPGGNSSSGEMTPPDRLAYVIYTSGSTGKPKGAAICHGGIENNACQVRQQLVLSPADVVLATATVAFDFSCLEFYPTLISGACLYIVERECARDGDRLMEVMQNSGATVVMGTPTLWNLLLETGWKGNPKLKIIAAGEALPLTLGRTLAKMTGAVWNHYGPTETTISVSAEKVEADAEIITIGSPMANIRMHILDTSRQPVPKGEPGEIYIGGICVGRGYIKRDDLNKVCFLPDPFDSAPGARIYKTGDLGRELPDGRIEYLGRKDHQVKIRGYRIELKEIEESIRKYPGVRAVSVQAVEVSSGDQRLVAFIQSGPPVETDRMKEFLRKTLPYYMVPLEYVAIKELPVNANGKVDRQALIALRPTQTDETRTILPPKNATEFALKESWERILKISPISVQDDFFELGGNSFLAARLFTEMQRKLGTKVPLSILVEHPTIESLAQCIRQQESRRKWPGVVTIRTTGDRAPLFLAHGLGGSLLIFHDLVEKLRSDRPVYGLQLSQGMAENKDQLSITKLASIYINQMKAVRPTGPYHLAGHSLGAILAYEVAAQLAQSGEEVGLLALFDWDLYAPFASAPLPMITSMSSGTQQFKDSIAFSFHRLVTWLPRLLSAGRRERIYRKYLYEKIRVQYFLLKHFPTFGRLFPSQFGEDLYVAVSTEHYRPKPFPGDALVFMAADQLRPVQDFGSGWKQVVRGNCEILRVPGTHQTIFKSPNVEFLAQELTQRLQAFDRAQTERESPAMTGS